MKIPNRDKIPYDIWRYFETTYDQPENRVQEKIFLEKHNLMEDIEDCCTEENHPETFEPSLKEKFPESWIPSFEKLEKGESPLNHMLLQHEPIHDRQIKLTEHIENIEITDFDSGALTLIQDHFSLGFAYRDISKKYGNKDINQALTIIETFFMQLVSKTYEFLGYWTAKFEGKLSVLPGASAKKKGKQKRVEDLKNRIEKVGNFTEEGLYVNNSDWHKAFVDVFGYHGVSASTMNQYKDEIEKLLSSENCEIIKIIINKKS